MMPVFFETLDEGSGLRQSDSYDAIRNHRLSYILAPQQPSGVVSGHTTVRSLGMLRLMNCASPGISYVYGASEIRGSDCDDFLCFVVLNGHGTLEHKGRCLPFRAGDLLFYDTLHPYALSFPEGGRTHTIVLPRALVVARLPEAAQQTALKIDAASPLAELARSMMREIARLPFDDTPLPPVESALLELLCIALRDRIGQAPRPSPAQAQLLNRVKRTLVEHLSDSDLTLDRVAQLAQLPRRTLIRAFAAEGTTVMKWVMEQRLAESYRALAERQVSQVTEAAFRFGFKDSSHFTRAFKREYNLRPSDLLGK